MPRNPTRMHREISEIPDAVARLLQDGQTARRQAVAKVRALDPAFIITVGRGSSDHVCTYLKYAAELGLGLPVASVGPSIASVYKAPLRLQNALCLSISQSGQSPDIVEMSRAAAQNGALVVALTNEPASPLAMVADVALNIHAGTEQSVAATKTFVTSAVAGLALWADWNNDTLLQQALHALPPKLARAAALDWPEMRAEIGKNPSLYTIGRGPAWAVANEASLKFKETCQLHSESFSSAEVLHGPVSMVSEGFPVLAFAAADAAEDSVVQVADQMAAMGARVFVTSAKSTKAQGLAHIRTGHPLTDPLSLIVSFYAMVERLALERGGNPDLPRHLNKVTETI